MALYRNNRFSYWMRGEMLESWTDHNGFHLTNDRPSFAWVDIETTGLDKANDIILNLGITLTNEVGDICQDGVIDWLTYPMKDDATEKAADLRLEQMVPYVREMHEKNGLLHELQQARATSASFDLDTARVSADAALWLGERCGEQTKDYIVQFSGSSAHFDRGFIENHMLALNSWFHYRNGVDISGIREIARRTAPWVLETQPDKLERHRPIPDLADSIRLYRHLLKNYLACDAATNQKLRRGN